MGCQDGIRSAWLRSVFCLLKFSSEGKPKKQVPTSLSDGSQMEFLRSTGHAGVKVPCPGRLRSRLLEEHDLEARSVDQNIFVILTQFDESQRDII